MKITNEQIAEALGYSCCQTSVDPQSSMAWFKHPLGPKSRPVWDEYYPDTPNFLNDLNACFKYDLFSKLDYMVGVHIMADAWKKILPPEKIATEICEAFIQKERANI